MATIRTYVEVDADEVLDELSDDDLLNELKSRKIDVPLFGDREHLMRDIEDAARAGRAFDLLLLVQSAILPSTSPCKATPYESLPRDPITGRPVIQ